MQQYAQPIGTADPTTGAVTPVNSANPLPVTGGQPGGTGQTATMLSNAAGAGTTGTDITWQGGEGTIEVDTTGAFNGTNVIAQYKSKTTGNWNAMAGPSSLAGPGQFVFVQPPQTHIRLLLSGGTPTGMQGSVTAN